MAPGLPVSAVSALETYRAALDDTSVAVEGVYLTGSAVLDDWQPDSSDLDILVVTPEPLDEVSLAALEDLHGKHPDRPYLDAVYVPRSFLGAADGTFAHVVDGKWQGVSFRPNPVLWATLDSRGATLRGPSAQELGVAPYPLWLREWNLENLASYWQQRMAASARTWLHGLDPDSQVPAAAVVWGALGPGRLHCTIATGEIISKTASADYTAALPPAYGPLLARAKAFRLGDASVTFSVQDGLAACDLIDAVADSAARVGAR
jgi:hypothetical protein